VNALSRKGDSCGPTRSGMVVLDFCKCGRVQCSFQLVHFIAVKTKKGKKEKPTAC